MTQTLGHLQIETVRLHPGQEHPAAAGSWRFVYVQSGAAYWLQADRSRPLAEGELVVLSPDIAGSVRASQINDVALHTFSFMPELLGGFFTLAERHFFETKIAGNFPDAHVLPSTHPAARQLAAIIVSAEEPQPLVRRAALLGLAVSFFNSGRARLHLPAPRALSARHRFQQLISRMPDTDLVNHPPEQLAQLCGCSPRHFSRLFHQQFGSSVRARQTELRLLKARQLLRNPGLPVAQAAADSGYRHLGLFNSLFKRKFGMTPTEWRQQRENPASC